MSRSQLAKFSSVSRNPLYRNLGNPGCYLREIGYKNPQFENIPFSLFLLGSFRKVSAFHCVLRGRTSSHPPSSIPCCKVHAHNCNHVIMHTYPHQCGFCSFMGQGGGGDSGLSCRCPILDNLSQSSRSCKICACTMCSCFFFAMCTTL